MSKIRLARIIVRTTSVLFFILLLSCAFEGRFWGIPSDLYLRADPLAGAIASLASKTWTWNMWPALLVLLSAFLFGRIFCGWICPMGATLDAGGFVIRHCAPKRRFTLPRILWNIKYLFLIMMACAAFFGLNVFFWGSPIALVTRFYALVLEPILHIMYNWGVLISQPLINFLGGESLLYSITEPASFHSFWFVAIFWLLLFLLEWLSPRFWCRYLCPGGALLGLVSRFKILLRHVTGKCIDCGACALNCPAGILANPHNGSANECLVCGNCQAICPKKAVTFEIGRLAPQSDTIRESRRSFLSVAACGAALGCLTPLTFRNGEILVRPPGAVPEEDFLAVCLRCGQCMAACPDNALQPTDGFGDFLAIFSPKLDPYSGGCQPDCAACGHVCPTGALQPLKVAQKRWAKVGTAVIDKNRCLAWHEDRRCMVCKENCPYNAVDVVTKEYHIAPVPVVYGNFCYGCGFCQKACPTSPASIIVGPAGALRLTNADYEIAAKEKGLDFTPGRMSPGLIRDDAKAPPGFLE